jgi:hypothetical protein
VKGIGSPRYVEFTRLDMRSVAIELFTKVCTDRAVIDQIVCCQEESCTVSRAGQSRQKAMLKAVLTVRLQSSLAPSSRHELLGKSHLLLLGRHDSSCAGVANNKEI